MRARHHHLPSGWLSAVFLLTHSRFYSLNKNTFLCLVLGIMWPKTAGSRQWFLGAHGSVKQEFQCSVSPDGASGTRGTTGGVAMVGWAKEKGPEQCGQEGWGGREEGPFLEGLRAEMGV